MMLTALAWLTFSGAPDAALLERLAAHAAQMETYSANASFTVDVIAEEYDSDGKATKTTKSSMRVSRKAGKESRKLLRYEEDGVDITEKKRAEVEKAESKPVHSPFHANEQPKYRFTLLESPGKPLRIAMEPAGRKTPELIIGEADVDPESGEVRFISMRPSKNPAFVDSLALTASFDGKAMSQLTIKGVGGFLFIKKRFGVVTTFRDSEATRD